MVEETIRIIRETERKADDMVKEAEEKGNECISLLFHEEAGL